MNSLIFVSAQPDLPYFHWQVKLYVHNFIQKGINPKNIHVLFAIPENEKEPSDGSIEILKTGVNLHFFKDDRENKQYIPSIKPYLISKWLEKNKSYGNLFFLHDADIIFNKLPNFDSLISGDTIYLSNTKNYIGYEYLKKCSKNYEIKFSNCKNEELIDIMCDVVGIKKTKIIENEENSGGGQYIIKNTNYKIWQKIYKDSNSIYSSLIKFQRKYPINHGKIQFWTSEMWSLIWNLWVDNKQTLITKELDFCWATDTTEDYDKTPESMKIFIRQAFVINHIDHNKKNNNVTNLEWVTQKANTFKALKHYGGNCANANKTKKEEGV